jgi:nucleotide-binding universal stress UspA family protein
MKIVLAAVGSRFTKKALAFLTAQNRVDPQADELLVINVQPAVPAQVKTFAGAAAVNAWHRDEAQKVLAPIERFLARHEIAYRTKWVVGRAPDEIIRLATDQKAGMIVMGTHGYGVLGRAVMGSVAQQVVHGSPVPVLLV